MKISNNGLQQIIKREGVILHAYHDSVGVLTIGTGHTSAAGEPQVVPGMVITKEQNDEILRRDLEPIQQQLNAALKVKVSQNQYDALVSIIFNVGPSFLNSTCMHRLNAGDYKGAAEAIMMWNKPPEIIGRRATEKKQFLTPDNTVLSPLSTTHAAVSTSLLALTGAFITGHKALIIVAGALILIGGIYAYLENKKKQNVQ